MQAVADTMPHVADSESEECLLVSSIPYKLGHFGCVVCRNERQSGEIASVEVICMILLPLAMLLCFYALALFLWRSKMIALTVDGIIDDRRGPLCLAAIVSMALLAIFIFSLHDLVSTMSAKQQDFTFILSSIYPSQTS